MREREKEKERMRESSSPSISLFFCPLIENGERGEDS